MKYYVKLTNTKTGKVLYKWCKTLDTWSPVKDYCWRFSKQGAQRIVKRLQSIAEHSGLDHLHYSIEEVENDA